MTVDEVLTAITTVGFPICAYLLMYFDLKKQIKELAGVISSNTNLISTLIEHFHEEDKSSWKTAFASWQQMGQGACATSWIKKAQ